MRISRWLASAGQTEDHRDAADVRLFDGRGSSVTVLDNPRWGQPGVGRSPNAPNSFCFRLGRKSQVANDRLAGVGAGASGSRANEQSLAPQAAASSADTSASQNRASPSSPLTSMQAVVAAGGLNHEAHKRHLDSKSVDGYRLYDAKSCQVDAKMTTHSDDMGQICR